MFTLSEVNGKVPDGFNVVVYTVLFGGWVFKSSVEKKKIITKEHTFLTEYIDDDIIIDYSFSQR